VHAWGAGRRKHLLAASIVTAALAALAGGIAGTAPSASASWPDGRVAALWPTFSGLPAVESGAGGVRRWNGTFRSCVESSRVQLDFRCKYADAAGNVGYVCLSAGGPPQDISRASIHAVVAPADPTYGSASPAQVCFASLAYAMSLG
jgi:hypothetical protein